MNRRRPRLRATILLVVLLSAAAAWLGVRHGGTRVQGGEPAVPSITALLGNDDSTGFAHAERVRAFDFPRDHGAHPDFRNEWWYFSGNLEDDAGRAFGFQMTLFRFALRATAIPSSSAWRTSQVMAGHFAIADIDARRHYAHERVSRAALGIAGFTAPPPAVWIDDWRILLVDAAAGTWRLAANAGATALALELRALRPVTPQGDAGLSRKGASRGNASYYYSIGRLAATGSITTPAGRFSVHGLAWLDREWSTSALAPDQSGWDWFAMQFDDGDDLMFYRLRRADGAIDTHSRGAILGANGNVTALRAADVRITAVAHWRSPATGIRYPAGWRFEAPRHGIDVRVLPRLADQEWSGLLRYWEGAVRVSGRRRGQTVAGLGYVELTGYGATP